LISQIESANMLQLANLRHMIAETSQSVHCMRCRTVQGSLLFSIWQVRLSEIQQQIVNGYGWLWHHTAPHRIQKCTTVLILNSKGMYALHCY